MLQDKTLTMLNEAIALMETHYWLEVVEIKKHNAPGSRLTDFKPVPKFPQALTILKKLRHKLELSSKNK